MIYRVSWTIVAAALLSACATRGHTMLPATNGIDMTHFMRFSAGAGPAGRIKHIVVVIQENRTLNDLFGGPDGFPGAYTVAYGSTSKGKSKKLVARSLGNILDLSNFYPKYLNACNAPNKPPFPIGKPSPCRMNGFDKNDVAFQQTPYSYVPHKESKPYWDLAKAYTLGDRFFSSHNADSYTGHQYLFSGQSAGIDQAPVKTGGFAFFTKWSCGADNDARSYLTDPGTWQQTKDPVGPRPCFNYLSIADLLNQKGLRWRMYTFAPNYNINGLGVNRSIWVKQFQNYSYVTFTSSRLLDDLKEPNYKLAEVTWVLPSPFCSDHPMAGPAWCGPTWVASVVDALAKSHFWNDTAIFVTWDDWGGFYDPVPPYVVRDAFGPGPRIPLIVAGGYAKRHHVSHVNTEFGTLLAFIEETFWLPNLGGPAEDTSPYLNNFDDFFDFNSPPKAPTLVPYAKPVEFFRQREDLKLLEKYPGLRRFFMGDD